MSHFVQIPSSSISYWLLNANVPAACLALPERQVVDEPDLDDLCLVDLHIGQGKIKAICSAGSLGTPKNGYPIVDLQGGLVFPTFADLHTHIGTIRKFKRSTPLHCWLSKPFTYRVLNHSPESSLIRTYGVQCKFILHLSPLQTKDIHARGVAILMAASAAQTEARLVMPTSGISMMSTGRFDQTPKF